MKNNKVDTYKKKTHNRWVNDVLWASSGENAKLQNLINRGLVYQQDARTQLKIRALIDAGVLTDRVFTINGREV